MVSRNDEIILFHYASSIYSHRIIWYLKLAGIKYTECIQPPILPRPDVAALGVSYRRMPILSIGKHVYCDSRIILQVLQDKCPLQSQAATCGVDKGIEILFQHWSAGLFRHATGMLPFESSPLVADPKFISDRTEMIGVAFVPEMLKKGRPESMSHIRSAIDTLEKSFLGDGRNWILGEAGPTAADIEAVYLFRWLINDLRSLKAESVSEALYPKTYTWVRRFNNAVASAAKAVPKPERVKGEEAIRRILGASEGDWRASVDPTDPLIQAGLKAGQQIEVWPTDTGTNHHDFGELVALAVDEVCIRNKNGVLVHFPRWNFRIRPASSPKAKISTAVTEIKLNQYRLIYHPMSPYSRKVYMVARELGFDEHIKLQTVVVAPIHYPGWSDNNADVAVYNPMAKLPTLVLENGDADAIYDSRMICDFLESEAKSRKTTEPNWRLKVLHACADGIMDALVLIVYEKKIRAEKKIKFDPWIVGQTEKVMRSLDRLELEAGRGTLKKPQDGAIASATEVAIAVAVGFVDINRVQWRSGRPKLQEWMAAWEKRESFVKTRPNVDWKTGEPADIGFAREALAGAKSSKI